MKKAEAVEALDNVGRAIGDVSARMWSTALSPNEHGIGASLLSVAAIPIVSTAAFGQMLTSVVVREIPEGVFDSVSNLGGK
jgi:hypothetical protein